MGHLADIHQVVCQTRQQFPGFGIIEKAVGQPLDMAVKIITDIPFDIRSEHVAPICNDELHESIESIHQKQPGGCKKNPLPIS